VLIDQNAYTNRWRQVNPAAKAVFGICGICAAFLAGQTWLAGTLALIIALITIVGAGIPVSQYLRAIAPALFFLGISAMTLLVSFDGSGITFTGVGHNQAMQLCGRATASITALLFLALTTPMSEIIALLRKLKLPDLMLDIAVIGYRMLFVLLATVRQIQTAQAARLGYDGPRHAFRSLGQMIAAVTLQVWQRATALDLAAETRCSNGTLHFITPVYADTGRDLTVALLGGTCMIILTLLVP